MLRKVPLELLFFSTALLLLYFMDVAKPHHSFCPLDRIGFDFCPGCGIGRSLHYFMHGDFNKSWQMHPLGFFAFFVIIFRICGLTRKTFIKNLRVYDKR